MDHSPWCGQRPNSAFSSNKLLKPLLTVLILFTFALCCTGAKATTFFVPSGGDLQAAINAATFGDTIVLTSGGVYPTPAPFQPYILTDKGSGSGFITITSSIAPPADGTRVTLADRANMAKCIVRNG